GAPVGGGPRSTQGWPPAHPRAGQARRPQGQDAARPQAVGAPLAGDVEGPQARGTERRLPPRALAAGADERLRAQGRGVAAPVGPPPTFLAEPRGRPDLDDGRAGTYVHPPVPPQPDVRRDLALD